MEGSADHPLIRRYPGSMISRYRQSEFDTFEIPLGPAKRADEFTKSKRVEGKVTAILYKSPEGRSLAEIFKNYESALKNAGFEVLFACADKKCGVGATKNYLGGENQWSEDEQRAIALRRPGPPEVHVVLRVFYQRTWLAVVEAKPMEEGKVEVNAAVLGQGLEASGHFAVYGIFFDTGKADLDPKSDPTLREIAKFLTEHPKAKLHVVGHTDNVGALSGNLDLSNRRAQSVIKALATRYRVASDRLSAHGVASLSPVATNRTDEGRAKNRRVELVEQ
jgi:outer membrane protein OmpA-like peptidoglycan-associated protein